MFRVCRNGGPDAAAQYERIRCATESILGQSQVGSVLEYVLGFILLRVSGADCQYLQPAQASEASAAATRWRPELLIR